jgi:hypothetical protein
VRTDPDADLREWFQGMREHDCAAAPAFESILPHAPARALRGGPRLAWTAGGFALVATAGLFLILRLPTTPLDSAAVALPAWQSPTDFLLAGVGDSLQRLSWAPSPTSVLSQPSFNRYREDK